MLWRPIERHIREPVERAVLESSFVLFAIASVDALTGPPPAFRLLYVAPVWHAARAQGLRAGLVLVGLTTLVLTVLDAYQGRSAGIVGIANLALYGLILLGLMLHISRVEHGIQAYARMAALDPLTGVCNRLALQQAAANAISRACSARRPLTLVVIDCDKFKELNDERGHAHGDVVLVTLARLLRRAAGASGVVARTGGDEFVAILPGKHLDEANAIVARVAQEFADQTELLGQECTLSYGLARLGIHGNDLPDLMAAADRQMYMAKTAFADLQSLAESA